MVWADGLGMEPRFERGLAAVADLPDGFVVAGFSQGSSVAGYVATRRAVSGVLQLSGLNVVEWFGAGAAWPTGVDSQCHQTVGAPFREDDITEQAMLDVTAAGDTISLPSFMLRISPAAAGSFWNRTALCGVRDTTSFARSFAAKGRSGLE